MKRGLIIGIVIVVVLVIIGIAAYPYVFSNTNNKKCIGEGKMGDAIYNDRCCEGLGITTLSSPSPDGNLCSTYGTQFTCTKNCGNGTCDSGENNCNCERDCGNTNYTCPTEKIIDCMLVVGATYPQTLSKYCEPNYRNWITQNCNVTFTN